MEIRQSRFGANRQFPHERMQRVNRAKNITIAVMVLLLLLVVGGIAYTWYMGQHPLQSAAQTPADTTSIAPKVKTYTPAPDAAVGIALQSFSGTAAQGENADISIKTNPGAACQITVKVKDQTLPDTGLTPKVADEFGIVGWSWNVPKNVPAGSWPVDITCANASKHAANYKADLKVTQL